MYHPGKKGNDIREECFEMLWELKRLMSGDSGRGLIKVTYSIGFKG